MKERPFRDIEIFQKKQKMRIFNSLMVPKNVKGGPLGFFNIHSGAKHQKNRRGDPLKTLKNFENKSHKAEKRGEGKSHSAEKLEGGSGFL